MPFRLICTLSLVLILSACSDDASTAADTATPETKSSNTSTNTPTASASTQTANANDSGWEERFLGKADAPVTLIEFASLGCIHCANFHKTVLPALQPMIDDGTLKIIFRDFPLDGLSLNASQLARCMPANNFYPFIKTLFEQRTTWLNAENDTTALKSLAAQVGLSDDAIESCLKNQKLLDEILAKRLDASSTYKVEATPTIYINGEKYTEAMTADSIVKAIKTASE